MLLNAPLVPFTTVTLLALKPVTDWLKVKVKVTRPVATPATLSVMVRVRGGMGLVLMNTSVSPALLPIRRSRSPSASRSPNVGLAKKPTSLISKGLVAAAA